MPENIKTEKAYVGYYATDSDTYDGAPDAGYPSNAIGHGLTPEEAIADLREQLRDDEADRRYELSRRAGNMYRHIARSNSFDKYDLLKLLNDVRRELR